MTSNYQTDQKVSLSEIKILLWDIDGTLLRSKINGAFRQYFIPTMQRVYGSAGTLENINASGMTDTQIIYESLQKEGFTPEQIFAKKAELIEVFKEEMSAVFSTKTDSHELLSGAHEILEEIDRNPKFINALLTGNLSVAAEIKLRSVGIWSYFENSINAFGEISHKRADLAVEAGKLFNKSFGFEFSPQQFIVIGDTPNDILCARHFGAKAVAVATGRGQNKEELLSYQPDCLLENLENTAKVLQTLADL